MFCCIKGTKKDHANNEGMLYKLFKYLYAPFLMKKWIRASVVIIFFGWLCSSLAVIPKIEIGLDQEVSMPEDSFVLKYFKVSQWSQLIESLARGFKLDMLGKITLSEKKAIIKSNEIFCTPIWQQQNDFCLQESSKCSVYEKTKKNLQTTLKWPLIVFIDFLTPKIKKTT